MIEPVKEGYLQVIKRQAERIRELEKRLQGVCDTENKNIWHKLKGEWKLIEATQQNIYIDGVAKL